MERYEPARFGMLRHPDGAWVEHDEAAAEIARLRAELGDRVAAYEEASVIIREMAAERDALRSDLREKAIAAAEAKSDLSTANAAIARLRAELEEARDGLLEYALHRPDCERHAGAEGLDPDDECECGLQALIDRLAAHAEGRGDG